MREIKGKREDTSGAQPLHGRLRGLFSRATQQRESNEGDVHDVNRRRLRELEGLAAAESSDLPDDAMLALRHMHAAGRSIAELITAHGDALVSTGRSAADDLSSALDWDLPRLLADYRKLNQMHDSGVQSAARSAETLLRAKLPVLAARLLRIQAELAATVGARVLGLADANRVCVSESDYVQASEFLHFLERSGPKELVDGKVLERSGAELVHQRVLRRAASQFEAWADAAGPNGPTVEVGPVPVRFSRSCILQPDLMLWLRPLPQRYTYPIPHVPDLIVEVLSSFDADYMLDRMGKGRIYGAAGVSELWLIDPRRQLVEQYVDRCRLPGTADHEQIGSELLPGFQLDIERVFRGCVPLPIGAVSAVKV